MNTGEITYLKLNNMKRFLIWLKYTRWKPIRYIWPYPEGYGIYRINRWTGIRTVVDRYRTKDEAVEACKMQNREVI